MHVYDILVFHVFRSLGATMPSWEGQKSLMDVVFVVVMGPHVTSYREHLRVYLEKVSCFATFNFTFVVQVHVHVPVLPPKYKTTRQLPQSTRNYVLIRIPSLSYGIKIHNLKFHISLIISCNWYIIFYCNIVIYFYPMPDRMLYMYRLLSCFLEFL